MSEQYIEAMPGVTLPSDGNTQAQQTDPNNGSQNAQTSASSPQPNNTNPYEIPEPPTPPNYSEVTKDIDDDAKRQRQEDAKKRRRRAVWNAVGDGLSALANLHFTGNYAPSMSTGRGDLSAKEQERWDSYVKNRDARIAEYRKAALGQADKQYEWKYKTWKDAVQMAEDQHKARMSEARLVYQEQLANARASYLQGKYDETQWKQAQAEAKADYEYSVMESVINKNNAVANYYNRKK